MKKNALAILFAILFNWGFSKDFEQVDFKANSDEEQVENIIQDEKGLLYFQTQKQIYFYDGKRTLAVFDSAFSQIDFASKIGDTWYVCANNSILFSYENGYLLKIATLENKVNDLVVFKNKIVVATAGSGAYFLESNVLQKIKNLEESYIYDALVVEDEIVFAGDLGLSIVSGEKVRLISVKEGLSDYIVYQIFTQNNLLLAYTFDGKINSIDLAKNQVTKLEALSNSPLEIHYSLNNTLYYSLDSVLVKQKNNQSSLIPLSFKGKKIFLSKENIIWFISKQGTIYKINENFQVYPSTGVKNNCVFVHSNENIWLSSLGKLEIKKTINNAAIITIPIKSKHPIVSFAETPNKHVFAGTLGDGIYIFDENGKLIQHLLEENGLLNNNIIHLEYFEGELWIASFAGLSTYDLLNKTFNNQVQKESDFNSLYLYAVLPISKNKVFIASDGEGLIVLENGKSRKVSLAQLQNETILCIEKDAKNIWVSIQDEGICYFNNTDTFFLTKDNGLRSHEIMGIYSNGKKALFAHEKGVDIYDITSKKITYVSLKNEESIDFQHFSFLGENILLAYENSLFEIDGDMLLNDRKVQLYLYPKKLFFEPTLENEFSYKENQFTFDFAGIWYENPSEVYYKYRLKGYEENWHTTQMQSVNYGNLPPGNYSFELAVGLYEDFPIDEVETHSFSIHKPFWLQIWFILGSIFLFFGLLYLLYRYRIQQIKQEEYAAKLKAQYEYENLKNQINPHFLFNSFNSLINLVDESPNKAIVYIEMLSNFFRNILTVEKYESIPLEQELEIANNFIQIQKFRFEENLSYEVQDLNNFQNYHVIPLAIQLLLENAIKHNAISKSKKLHIEIYVENEKLCVRNNINKKTSSLENSTQVGIKNIINRYALLSSEKVNIIQDEMFFIVKLPLLK